MNPPTQPSATPRTTTLFERQDVDPQTTNQDRWEEMTDHARTLETELAAANDKAERYRLCTLKQDAELADLRAENERLNGWVCELQTLIDNCGYPSGTDYAAMTARAERAEAQLAAAQCPNVVCSKEGTQYCALAESSVAKLEAQLAAARKDSERLDWVLSKMTGAFLPANNCCSWRMDHFDYGNNTPSRRAIDAAMTNSNHKTT